MVPSCHFIQIHIRIKAAHRFHLAPVQIRLAGNGAAAVKLGTLAVGPLQKSGMPILRKTGIGPVKDHLVFGRMLADIPADKLGLFRTRVRLLHKLAAETADRKNSADLYFCRGTLLFGFCQNSFGLKELLEHLAVVLRLGGQQFLGG